MFSQSSNPLSQHFKCESNCIESVHSDSTGESVQNSDNLNFTPKNIKKFSLGKYSQKKDKKERLIGKKTKREKLPKVKNNKFKVINTIFNEFCSSSLFNSFPQFNSVKKGVKNDIYSTASELAKEIRGIFSTLFLNNINS